jgi:hypothetical protein
MFETLFGKVSGLLARSFAASGLLPASALVLVLSLYFLEADKIADNVVALFKTPSQKAADMFWLLLSWVVLAALFFAARGWVAGLCQDVPWPRRLRDKLVRRQERLREALLREIRKIQMRLTALRWITLDEPLPPEYGTEFFRGESEQELIQRSASARARLEQETLSDAESVSDELAQAVTHGVEAAYALGLITASKNDWRNHQATWKALIEDGSRRQLVDRLHLDGERELVRLYLDQRKRFPDKKWIRPTAMGNRIEALEEYAADRYGIETSTLWTRLWWVLKPEERESVAYSKLAVETFFNLAVAFGAAALCIAVSTSWEASVALYNYAAAASAGLSVNWKAVTFIFVCAMLAALSHRAVSPAVDVLRDKTVGLVEVRRLALLRELGFRPRTVAEELMLWRKLKLFYVQANPLGQTMALHSADAKPEKDAGQDKD